MYNFSLQVQSENDCSFSTESLLSLAARDSAIRHFALNASTAPFYDSPRTMVRALRNGIMLISLLLVIIGGAGIVSVCSCHAEIFLFSCSCHEKAVDCGCGRHDSSSTDSIPAADHRCEHGQLEIDDPVVPAVSSPVSLPCIVWQVLPDFHQLAHVLLLTSQTAKPPAPVPPDPLADDGMGHAGFQRPLLI